jgi:hypothetical protein
MTDMSFFTAGEVWKGGGYELFIPADSSKSLCSLLKVLWTFPSVEGCYLRQDCEPPTQPRVQPCEKGIEQRLYGLVTLPNRSVSLICDGLCGRSGFATRTLDQF